MRMYLIDRKAVLEILLLWEVDSRVAKDIMKISTHAEGWEDRSAIESKNPGLAELIKANKELEDKARTVYAW
jgi:hypothetical protein